MKNIKLLLWLAFGFILTNCHKIDDYPLEFNSIDKVYSDSLYIQQFVNAIYNQLPQGYNRINSAMMACATDEAVHSALSSNIDKMAKGSWGPNSNPDNEWSRNYKGIRQTNDFLYNVLPGIPDYLFNSQVTIDNLEGQVRFLRALFNFELVKRYGGIPIVEEVCEASSNPSIPRSTYDDCVDYIVGECDAAAALLPDVYESDNEFDLGRATKAAALSL